MMGQHRSFALQSERSERSIPGNARQDEAVAGEKIHEINHVQDSQQNRDGEKTDQTLEPAKTSTCEDVPPNGGYGWVCVACVAFINAHTWGINSSYGVFLAYYLSHDSFANASSLEYAFVGGLSISMALMVSPIATTTTRLYGTRCTLFIGVILETLALITASFSHAVWQLFLSQGVCFGLGMGFLFVGSVGVIPQWFSTKRSLANGIGTAGSGIGGMMYSLATNAMLQNFGLAWTFRTLGLVTCGVNFICAVLMRDRSRAIGASHLAFDHHLLGRLEYWLFLFWGFFSLMGYVTLLFSLPAYAVSVGLTERQGSIIGALLNLGQGIGRPIVGQVSDQAGRFNLAGLCTFLAGLFCLVIWIFAQSYGVLIFFAILVGTVAGTFWTTCAPLAAEVIGLKALPSALSILWLFLVLPTTFSEAIALKLRQADTARVFLHAQIFAGFMYIAGSLCMWALRAWKVGQLEGIAIEQRRLPILDKTTPPKSSSASSHLNQAASTAPSDFATANTDDDLDMVELARTVSAASRRQLRPAWQRLFIPKRV